jgi:hypothetical protein
MKEKFVKVAEYIGFIVGAYVAWKLPGWINMNPEWVKFYRLSLLAVCGIGIYLLMKKYPPEKDEKK